MEVALLTVWELICIILNLMDMSLTRGAVFGLCKGVANLLEATMFCFTPGPVKLRPKSSTQIRLRIDPNVPHLTTQFSEMQTFKNSKQKAQLKP